MDNSFVQGSILSVTQISISGKNQTPVGIDLGQGNFAQLVLISGQPISVSGNRVDIGGSISLSGAVVSLSGQPVSVSGSIISPYIFHSGLHNITSIPSLTNILGSDITPTKPPSLIRSQIAVGISGGILNTVMTYNGNAQKVSLNGGATLASGALYVFDVAVQSGDSLNYQYSLSSPILVFRSLEIVEGAA